MSIAAVNGINLYYEEEGQGAPLVLISGYTTDISAWALIRQRLAKHFRLILVDNRGAGRSDSPDVPYTIETMAEDIRALMAFLHVGSAHILGHSMGTAIAQTLSVKHPTLIKKMVLANPLIHLHPAPKAALSFFLKMREQGMSLVTMIEGSIPWLFSSDFLKSPRDTSALLQHVATYPYPQSVIGQKRQLEATSRFNSEGWFKKIAAATLVIEGGEDIICPKDARRMSHEMPNASHHLFQSQAHMEHVEKPHEFADAVIDFCSN